jgi:poly(hydroxyalkanoate) depolymerase family esterase
MLHGCTQSARTFARATGMNRLAERKDFLVLYPDQSRKTNAWKCWNWFLPGHTTRGRGEVRRLADLIQSTLENHDVDPNRIYVAGFSAGGAMVPPLVAAYPELIAAGGIHSGFEYRAATGAREALSVRSEGGPDPRTQGRKAFEAMGDRARPVPIIVLHGTEDSVVAPRNGRQAARQAVRTMNHALRQSADTTPSPTINDPPTIQRGSSGEYPFERKEYRLTDGRLGVVYYSIQNMGHEWAGGRRGESHVAPGAPDASEIIWNFFDRHTLRTLDGRVNTPPTLSLNVQPIPAVAGSTVTLTVRSRDPDGRVVSYDWTVNGTPRDGERQLRFVPETPESLRVEITIRDDGGATRRKTRILPVISRPSPEDE